MPNFLPFDKERYRDQIDLKDKSYVDHHSSNTITFGSLLDSGWDWGRNDWSCYSMSKETLEIIRPRINSKIEDEYFFRELGTLPPGKFKMLLKRTINEAVAKWGPVYETIADGIDLTTVAQEDFRKRSEHSDFPQSALNHETEEYGTYSDAEQYSKVNKKGPLEAIADYDRAFQEPDAAVVASLNTCFSNFLSFNF